MKNTAERKPRRLMDEALLASRRDEILAAAARLFAEHGYAETDTQLLADELGVGKGTLYRYFPSKQELFLAAVDRVMVELVQAVEVSKAGIPDPLEQIAACVHAYFTFFANHPEFVELLMQERAQFKDRKKPTYFEHREANVERWRSLYRGLIAAGRVRDMPVERITDVMSDLMYGTIFTNYFTGQRKSPAEHARDVLDVVWGGILSEDELRRRRAAAPATLPTAPANQVL